MNRSYVEGFLAPFERLRRLELFISFGAENSFVHADQWEIFFSNHLLQLTTFNLNITTGSNDPDVIDQYRRPFWLDRHWYVAFNSNYSSLFTVPYFTPTSMCHSSEPVSSHHTTLLLEQHHLFYDHVTEFRLDSDGCKLPSRYNHVKKLFLDCSYIENNVIDLSQVQKFIVNTE